MAGESQNDQARHFEIAQALSSDYESVYYIDTVSGNYVEYASQGQYKDLSMADSGEDFFAAAQVNLLRVVYEEDQALIAQVMDRDYLLAETEGGIMFSITYRLVIEGEPVYYSFKAVRSVSNPAHLIIGVSNVNRQKQRELEFEAKLRSALYFANLDSLTGVRNRNAYMQLEQELDEQMARGEAGELALVICDLNGLKDANDRFGHATGDRLIKEACRLVCLVFDHSPVFRIGGDEFLVVLRNHDFDEREALLGRISGDSRANAQANHAGDVTATTLRPVIASGMGVFDPAVDTSMASVFERADVAMYSNKKALKRESE